MNIKVKTTIHYNGRDYAHTADLPPDVRSAYENSMAPRAVSLNHALDKILINGERFAGPPREGRGLYEDIMRVVENNGHVTLPIMSEPFLNRRGIRVALALLAAFGAAALVLAVKTIS